MSDKKGEQTILLSNSNNKGTAVEVGFKGDGSITIKSNVPVTVLSPTITLEAGEKGEIRAVSRLVYVAKCSHQAVLGVALGDEATPAPLPNTKHSLVATAHTYTNSETALSCTPKIFPLKRSRKSP